MSYLSDDNYHGHGNIHAESVAWSMCACSGGKEQSNLEKSRIMSIVLGKPKEHNRSQEISKTNIDTEEYTTRLELLYEVAQKASSYSEVLKLIEEILCVTQRILQASAASLLLIDEGRGELCFQATDDKEANTLRQMSLELDSGIVGWVARHGVPVVVNDGLYQ